MTKKSETNEKIQKQLSESVHKKKFLKIWQNPKENICTGAFFNSVAGLSPITLLKGDSSAGVFI